MRTLVQTERERGAVERQQAADALALLRQRLDQQERELGAERDVAAGLRIEVTAAAHAQTVDARLEELRTEQGAAPHRPPAGTGPPDRRARS